MRATWWQRMWRWLVVLETVCLGVVLWEIHSWDELTLPAGSNQLVRAGYTVAFNAARISWMFVGHLLELLFAVSAIMLLLVELAAWADRWRRRRALRKAERDALPAWDSEIGKDE
jgi:hypothetical protein